MRRRDAAVSAEKKEEVVEEEQALERGAVYDCFFIVD